MEQTSSHGQTKYKAVCTKKSNIKEIQLEPLQTLDDTVRYSGAVRKVYSSPGNICSCNFLFSAPFLPM